MELNFYLSILILFVSSFSLGSLFFVYYRHRSPFTAPNLPPGTMGYPVIGESLQLLSTGWKGHPEKFIFDRMAKHSSEVFKTSIFGQPTVMFCGAARNKFLFSNENKLVSAWWPESLYKVFPSMNSNEDFKKIRKLFPQFLKAESLKRNVGIMDAMAQSHFATFWENKTQVTVYPLAKRYTFALACRLLMSVEDENRVAKLSDPFQNVASGIISMPIDFPGTSFNKAIKAANLIRKELLGIVRQRKIDLAEGNNNASLTQDTLSNMLSTCTEDGQYINEFLIIDNILSLLLASHDTTGAACTFIVKYLAELPHIYERVYQEQMEIAKSKKAGELLNWDDVNKMRYSWNVACEVLRLSPPVQGNFRKASSDFIFNGYSIPKGWKLYWSANSTHKSPEYFPEPEKFDPSRFEGNGPTPYTFVPFGGGPRMCPGKEYARVKILIFMHNLVKKFKWKKLIPNEKIFINYPLPVVEKGLPISLYPLNKA